MILFIYHTNGTNSFFTNNARLTKYRNVNSNTDMFLSINDGYKQY